MLDNIAFYYKLSHKIERIIYPNFIFEKVIFSRLKKRKKVIFFNIEIITFYITSAFSILYLLLITSECQAPIISLFADENIKCGYSFSFIDSFHKKKKKKKKKKTGRVLNSNRLHRSL